MEVRDGFSATIGNTPLIRLRRASEATGCEILGKAEFLNPGGSVKDRAARGILDDAERRGLIVRGGTFVEGTAGQHRHRLRPPLQCTRLQVRDRDAGQPVTGKGGAAAHAGRRRTRREDRALLRSESLPETGAEGGRGTRRGHRQPVRQHGESRRALRDDGTRDLARHAGTHRRVHLRYRNRRHARWRFALPQGAEAGRAHRAGRSDGERLASLGEDMAN